MSHLNVTIIRAQNSVILSQTLIDVLKSEKGRKEALLKLQQQKELAEMKSDQKQTRCLELDAKANLPAWSMPIGLDDDMSLTRKRSCTALEDKENEVDFDQYFDSFFIIKKQLLQPAS